MNLSAVLVGLALATPAFASTITVTITGVTGAIRVGEGPIFGHSSYQNIPPGAPFVLTYTFDEDKGKQSVSAVEGDVIAESKIENASGSSPGTNAVLEIGGAMWEFGPSTHSQVSLNTSAVTRGEQVVFTTQAASNRVSAQIVPGKGGYWPKNADWRASFLSTSIDGSTAAFSADNDRVSAKGNLLPQTITVKGVDLDGQWLRSVPAGSSKDAAREWKLAHNSPQGGYIVEEVKHTILGSILNGSAITPSSVEYWQAWRVPAGSSVPAEGVDNFPAPAGSTGEDIVTATARFYEALTLPSSFAAGKSSYAAERLSSIADPDLPTNHATLPVSESVTLHY